MVWGNGPFIKERKINIIYVFDFDCLSKQNIEVRIFLDIMFD